MLFGRNENRWPISFIPHVTVGHFGEQAAAQALAQRLSNQVDITARVSRLDLVSFDGGPVALVDSWPLEGGRSSS